MLVADNSYCSSVLINCNRGGLTWFCWTESLPSFFLTVTSDWYSMNTSWTANERIVYAKKLWIIFCLWENSLITWVSWTWLTKSPIPTRLATYVSLLHTSKPITILVRWTRLYSVTFDAIVHKSIHDIAGGHRRLHMPALSSLPPPNEAIIYAAVPLIAPSKAILATDW